MNATGILTQPGTVDAGRLLSHSLNDRETWRQSEALVRSCLREASVLGTADDLPCTTVNHGKISVHIHGIVHGGSLFSRPAGRVRRFVQARVLEYAGPTGLNCLCEERFSRYWGRRVRQAQAGTLERPVRRSRPGMQRLQAEDSAHAASRDTKSAKG